MDSVANPSIRKLFRDLKPEELQELDPEVIRQKQAEALGKERKDAAARVR